MSTEMKMNSSDFEQPLFCEAPPGRVPVPVVPEGFILGPPRNTPLPRPPPVPPLPEKELPELLPLLPLEELPKELPLRLLLKEPPLLPPLLRLPPKEPPLLLPPPPPPPPLPKLMPLSYEPSSGTAP